MPHLKSNTRGMILAKAKQQQMLLTTKLCNRFLFLQPRSAVFHRKFNWNVKASDTNQRDKEKNGGAIHTIGVWSCFPYIDISTGFCMCTIIKLHVTIASARWAFVWPQEFCVYLNCMIKKPGPAAGWELCRLAEGKRVGIIWTEEAFGIHCKPHYMYFAELNCLIQMFRHWLIRVFQ